MYKDASDPGSLPYNPVRATDGCYRWAQSFPTWEKSLGLKTVAGLSTWLKCACAVWVRSMVERRGTASRHLGLCSWALVICLSWVEMVRKVERNGGMWRTKTSILFLGMQVLWWVVPERILLYPVCNSPLWRQKLPSGDFQGRLKPMLLFAW